MEVKLSKQAVKFLDKLSDKQTAVILDGIERLTEKPPKGDIKKLKGNSDCSRLRIANIRVIYRVEGEEILISDIDYIGNIYKNMR